MTTTRDPLVVLRQLLLADYGYMARTGKREITIAYDEGNHKAAVEAIAQVEALVRVATESERLMRHAASCDRVEVGPADELREALAPFTPGQDSEGGHGR